MEYSDLGTIDKRDTQEDAIRVAGGSDPTAIAKAISFALQEADTVSLRAIGASAVNQAVKATAIARGLVAQRGQDLIARPGFTTTRDLVRPSSSGSNELSCIVIRLSVV